MDLTKMISLNCYKGKFNKSISEFINFVNGHTDPFNRENSIGHITGSCWIVDETYNKALLTHHKKLDIWVHTGGHSEGEVNPLEISKREGFEETGLELELLMEDPFHIDIHNIPQYKNTPAHKHYDITYLFTPVSTLNYTVSNESHNLKWIELEEILGNSYENNIKIMAKKTIKLRESNGR